MCGRRIECRLMERGGGAGQPGARKVDHQKGSAGEGTGRGRGSEFRTRDWYSRERGRLTTISFVHEIHTRKTMANKGALHLVFSLESSLKVELYF
jgi:hypothetical protein